MMATSILKRLISTNIKQTVRRFHGSSIVRGGSTYEGDGKTTLSILNKDSSYGLMIDSYSEVGFRLNNGIMILGAIAIFPRTVLSWKVRKAEDINEETLSLFSVLDPKLDVLVIGIGSSQRTSKFDATILKYMNKYHINMEIVPTNQACAIFNFLNAEGRFVGAAIIPPQVIDDTEHTAISSEAVARALESPSNLF